MRARGFLGQRRGLGQRLESQVVDAAAVAGPLEHVAHEQNLAVPAVSLVEPDLDEAPCVVGISSFIAVELVEIAASRGHRFAGQVGPPFLLC